MASTFKDKIQSVISNDVCSWRRENKQIAFINWIAAMSNKLN